MRMGLRHAMANLFYEIPAALSCSARSVRVEQPPHGHTVNNPRSGGHPRLQYQNTLWFPQQKLGGTAIDFDESHRPDHVRGNVKTGHAPTGIAIKVHQELALTQVATKAIGKGGVQFPLLR